MITFVSSDGPAWSPRGILAASPAADPPGAIAVQFYQSPDWGHLRAAIMTALQDFPDARESLLRAIRSMPDLEKSDAPTP
jgi:hypothetical protein